MDTFTLWIINHSDKNHGISLVNFLLWTFNRCLIRHYKWIQREAVLCWRGNIGDYSTSLKYYSKCFSASGYKIYGMRDWRMEVNGKANCLGFLGKSCFPIFADFSIWILKFITYSPNSLCPGNILEGCFLPPLPSFKCVYFTLSHLQRIPVLLSLQLVAQHLFWSCDGPPKNPPTIDIWSLFVCLTILYQLTHRWLPGGLQHLKFLF